MGIEFRPYQSKIIENSIEHFKKSPDPVVVSASVGAGKSLIAAAIAKHVAEKNGRTMVIQRQGELADQNSGAAWSLGLMNSVYSASLKIKSMAHKVIYATEGTIYNALNTDFANFKLDLIIIDECHQCDYERDDSQFMTILNHFYTINPKLRVLGLTGSPFRGVTSIIGPFWKDMIGNISTDKLIDEGYLVPPTFGWPDGDEEFDFSSLEPSSSTGEYTEKQLDEILNSNPTLTQSIIAEVVHRTKDRHGVLIFASTKRHTKEIAKALPEGSYGIITDATPDAKRAKILDDARNGRLKYVVNVSCLTTGVDVPRWDTLVYLRPVGSLVLLTQSIGRILRLCPEIGKESGLVLDYAGVMDRLGHLYNNPILDQAGLEKAKRDGNIIHCPRCNEENSDTARRCIGRDRLEPDGRCGFFWKSNLCPKCGTENDISASECRQPSCRYQLRDPNKSLLRKAYSDTELVAVKSMDLHPTRNGGILVKYTLQEEPERHGHPVEFFKPDGDSRARTIWNQKFLKDHAESKQAHSLIYPLRNSKAILSYRDKLRTPTHIAYRINDKDKFVIGRKIFDKHNQEIA